MALSTWLDYHLESFVRPYLGYIPNIDPVVYGIKCYTSEVLDCLLVCWNEAKRRGEGFPMLLAGRDTWEFEVLARLENYPTTFRPDISSHSIDCVKDDYTGYYLVDSGNKGTIPRKLGITHYDLVYCSLNQPEWGQHCFFPHFMEPKGDQYYGVRKHFSSLYGALEGSSKYWSQAEVGKDGKPEQHLMVPEYFANAAMITQLVAKYAMRRNLADIKMSPLQSFNPVVNTLKASEWF